MMSEHDRMPGGRLDRDLEFKFRELVTEPLGRVPHILLVHGLGADAGNAQQVKQPFARLIQVVIHLREHSTDHGIRSGDHGVISPQTAHLIGAALPTCKFSPTVPPWNSYGVSRLVGQLGREA